MKKTNERNELAIFEELRLKQPTNARTPVGLQQNIKLAVSSLKPRSVASRSQCDIEVKVPFSFNSTLFLLLHRRHVFFRSPEKSCSFLKVIYKIKIVIFSPNLGGMVTEL